MCIRDRFYVNERWLGGMLTNFKTIQSRIQRLKDIERMAEDGTFDVLPKKEVIEIKKEWDKLEKNQMCIRDRIRYDERKRRQTVQDKRGRCYASVSYTHLDVYKRQDDDAVSGYASWQLSGVG